MLKPHDKFLNLLTLFTFISTFGSARVAILKNFKRRTIVMDSFFSNFAGYHLTKKGLHQGFFLWNLLNFSKQFFQWAAFGEKFCFFQAFMIFLQCFQQSYSISPITLRELFWCSPIKTIVIWVTKQIKILKVVGTFLWKFPWWSLVFINPQGSITDAGLQHWDFSWKVSIFFRKPSLQNTQNYLLLILRHFLIIW